MKDVAFIEPNLVERERRAVTLKDVAAFAGVHFNSVSVVLNGGKSSSRVSDATRERILQAAQELGYRRNNVAVNMQSGRSGWITLLYANAVGALGPNMGLMDGVGSELSKHNLHLHVERVEEDAVYDEKMWPRVLREWVSDGIILVYEKMTVPRLEEILHRHRIPAVWTNAKREANCIYPDDEGSYFLATEELLKLGHRRIAYIAAGSVEHYSYWDRKAGYERAMQNAALHADIIALDPDIMQSHDMKASVKQKSVKQKSVKRYEIIRSIVQRPVALRPTAVLCYSDEDALGLWTAALVAGIRVPEELSIVAASAKVSNFIEGKRLSEIGLPFVEVGSGAVKMLIQKIENPNHNLSPQTVPLRSLRGDTHTVVPKEHAENK